MYALLLALSAPAHASGTIHVTVDSGHHHARPARSGSVRVFNDTRRSVDLYADGRWLGEFAPGTAHVTLPLGQTTLRAEVDGFTFLRGSVNVSSHGSQFTISPPRTGALVIDNDSPVDLTVYIDGQWTALTGGDDRLVLDLRPGEYRVDVVDERGHGQTLRTEYVMISGYRVAEVEVHSAPYHVRPETQRSSGHGHGHGHHKRR